MSFYRSHPPNGRLSDSTLPLRSRLTEWHQQQFVRRGCKGWRHLCQTFSEDRMIKQATTRQRGFTLVEMAVTLVVLAIAVGYAIPAYQGLSADSSIRSTSMDLIAAINEARGQSLSTRSNITFKATDSTNWSNGWTVTDGTTSHTWQVGGKDTVSADPTSATSIVFQSNGFISTAAVTFTICDDRTGEKGSVVTLAKNGRVSNGTATCS
jgi:type IV fimbrial biogenesis protein FimT